MAPIVEVERRLMYGSTVATILGFSFMVIATSTDHWLILSIPHGIYLQSAKTVVNSVYVGLWRICRYGYSNETGHSVPTEYCEMLKFYPTTEEIRQNPEIDSSILDYRRTITAFAIISLILMVIGHVFVFYSFREPRYMFKRLASFLHMMSAVAVLVAVEVLINAAVYEKSNLPKRHPQGASLNYGFSFGFAWVSFIAYLISGIIFLVSSRKRKGERAGDERTALENEPMHLGRV